MDLGSLAGLFLGAGLILLGNHLEGGKVDSLLQPTAALIVFGGTLGACVLQFPLATTIAACTSVITIFFHKKVEHVALIVQIVDYAKRARREGILALEKELGNVTNPFFAKALRMAVDGIEPKQLLETMEAEMTTIEEEQEGPVKFLEAAGGYAPTIGIIGAVLGLILIMSDLSDVEKLGHGIGTAFVATVYGVGSANLILLPFSTKLKILMKEEIKYYEIALKGVLLIQEGINHTIIEEQLKSYLTEKDKRSYEASGGGAAA